MNCFYTPDIHGKYYQLSKEEARHCTKVLRLHTGSVIYLTDGHGNLYKSMIIESSANHCIVEIISIEHEYKKRNYYVHIAIAPTKNICRFEWFVEKATEIGVDEITPIICKYSERRIIKTEHINKIAISAMKQSIKAYLPKINDAVNFDDFIINKINGKKFIAHCYPGEKPLLKNVIAPNENALVCIGPEGDFAPEEIQRAYNNRIMNVSLGNQRLRTETAGIYACSTICLINETL